MAVSANAELNLETVSFQKDADSLTSISDTPWVLHKSVPQVMLGTLLATFFAFRLIGTVEKCLFLWPISAVSVGLALPYWHEGRKRRAMLQSAAAAGFIVGALIVRMPPSIIAILTCLKCLDLVLVKAIFGKHIASFDDLKNQANIVRFLSMIVAVPCLLGSLGAAPLAHYLGQPLLQTAAMNTLANSLGFAVVLPALLFMQGKIRSLGTLLRVPQRNACLMTAFFVVISSAIFWQNRGPFLFMVFPPLVGVLLVTGLEGAAFSSIILSMISWIATSHGHGPIWLMKGTPLEHLLAVQAFVWVCVVTALPIGALLDERKHAELGMEKALAEKGQLAKDLEASRHLFQNFIERSPNVTFIKDANGRYVFYNAEFAKLFGIDRSELLLRTDYEFFPRERADVFRANDLRVMESQQVTEIIEHVPGADNSIRCFKSVKFSYRDVDGNTLLAGVAADITDQVEREKELANANHQLELMAMTDALTGLPNRRAFESRISAELAAMNRHMSPLSLLVLDIDNFKKRNDVFGHAVGDAALKVLGEVLAACVRGNDFGARIGGEEFAVLIPDTDAIGAMNLASRIQAALRLADHGPTPLTISVGVTTSHGQREESATLLSQADAAMYEAKRTGKDRVLHYGQLSGRIIEQNQ